MPEINYLAVLVSGVVYMIVGSLWYGPLFGNIWMRGVGLDPNDKTLKAKMQKSAGPAYIQMFIGALITAFVFAHVLWAYRTANPIFAGVGPGLQGAFWMWLGFIAPLKYGEKLWAGKKFKFVAVDLSYQLVCLLIAGVILNTWI
jgi:hypothetical protein